MPERWWIQVCPECNGLMVSLSGVHNETCPNRHGRMFVARDVEVIPAATSDPERRSLDDPSVV